MSPSAGVRIGPYEILSLIGAGGMGEVYRARDTKLNRDVAIKFLSGEIAETASLQRFQQEAQTASSLNHPHILTVFDVGEKDGRHYLVTELIDGGTLKDWAHAERRSWRQVIDLLIGVADGLAAAHASSVLHRDIKPENILVTRNGYAKLADFGLAKLVSDAGGGETRTVAAPATRRGVIVGTIAYMSPEQASGKALDARSDIFSFGVLLHELLSGQRPFAGASDLALLQAIVHEAPKPLAGEVPWGLRVLVDKALEKDPADRYQTMSDLVVDLRRLARGRGAAPTPPVPTTARTTWWLSAAVAGLTLAAAAALGFAIVRGPVAAPDNPLAAAQFSRLTDFEGAELDAAISPDGKFVAFLADRDGPFDLFLTRVGSGTFTRLTHGDEMLRQTLRSVGFSGDGSEIWLHSVDNASPVRIMPLMGGQPRAFLRNGSIEVAWAPDGTRIAYHMSNGDPVFVADSAGGNARQILGDGPDRHNHFPVWSPDGKWIYLVRGIPAADQMDLWRISPAGGEPERVTEHNGYVAYPAPIDTRTVLYVAQDAYGAGPWLWAVDVDRKVTRRVSTGLEIYTSIAASADGRRLVASVANPSANLWSVPILDRPAVEGEARPFRVPTVRALAPRFGGTSLFYLSSAGSGDGLWRLQDGQAQEVWKGAEGALLEPPAVSRDGQRVAFVLRRSGKRRLQIATADGTEPHAADDTLDVQGTASWSPDGNWIVTGGTDARGPGLFKIPAGGGPSVRIGSGPALNPVWSPTGRMVVYSGANVGQESRLLAVNPDGARVELPTISVQRDGERFRFLPDGNGLVFMRGTVTSQDFWLLDLSTHKTRALTHLDPNSRATMRTFDITPDGKLIVFDRLRENSDIVLIDRPK